jgi:NAD(P)H dehydrogenase (quinone)
MRTLDARVAVIYYSATGTIHRVAEAFVEGALREGADVRLRRVPELAPDEVIDRNPAWRRHLEKTSDIPAATHADLEWANAYAFGTPTRYGNVCAQLRMFLDTTAGLWQRDVFVGKPATGFTSSYRTHGGQESTLLSLYNTLYHWGTLILPRGYLDSELVERTGGNPYGVSVSLERAEHEPGLFAGVLDTARFQGGRLAALAGALAPTLEVAA